MSNKYWNCKTSIFITRIKKHCLHNKILPCTLKMRDGHKCQTGLHPQAHFLHGTTLKSHPSRTWCKTCHCSDMPVDPHRKLHSNAFLVRVQSQATCPEQMLKAEVDMYLEDAEVQ